MNLLLFDVIVTSDSLVALYFSETSNRVISQSLDSYQILDLAINNCSDILFLRHVQLSTCWVVHGCYVRWELHGL